MKMLTLFAMVFFSSLGEAQDVCNYGSSSYSMMTGYLVKLAEFEGSVTSDLESFHSVKAEVRQAAQNALARTKRGGMIENFVIYSGRLGPNVCGPVRVVFNVNFNGASLHECTMTLRDVETIEHVACVLKAG